MRTFFLTTLLLLLSFSGISQEFRTFIFVIQSNDPQEGRIEGVSVTISNFNGLLFIGKTDSSGLAQSRLPEGKVFLSCSHPNYLSFERDILINEKSKDTIYLSLRPIRLQTLKEVKVKPSGIPDTVFADQEIQVDDFEIFKNGDLLLLSHEKFKARRSRVILYNGLTKLNEFGFDYKNALVQKDYQGNVYCMLENEAFCFRTIKGQYEMQVVNRPMVEKYILPIEDTMNHHVYYSDYQKLYPAFSYYHFQDEDSVTQIIRTIQDNLMMELYRAEYKWQDVRTKMWAEDMESETGIDAEIWVGASVFTQSPYYKALYAPLFRVGARLYVFDFYKDQLLRYDLNGNLIEASLIDMHLDPKKSGWKKIIQDSATKQLYCVYENSEKYSLGLINLQTGQIDEKVNLHFKNVDQIKIHNGMVYYLYRPFESTQTKYLYKEKLPLGWLAQ